ncbi:MAG TPA: hypothetical protein VK631_07055 [Solirubrobacteraceae bacterium]|nr:hypothetical protein [Solirubrobacteraceae bacterium]
MTSLLARIGAFFLDPPAQPEPSRPDEPRAFAPPTRFTPPTHISPPLDAAPSRATPAAPASSARSSSAAEAASNPVSSAAPAAPAPFGPSSSASEAASNPAGESAGGVASAAVLGAPAAVVPVAAACAGELRARARSAAALLCVWRPAALSVPAVDSAVPAAQSPAGATTPGARRLAARLAADGLPATACGRLAWLALESEPAAAAGQYRRCLAVGGGGPVVLAVAGARPPAFEPLLAELDLAIAVLPADIDPALRELALATLRSRDRAVLPPLPPGPPRWAAMAGLARLRSLPRETP